MNSSESEPKPRRIPKPIWFAVAGLLMVVLWVFLAVWLPYHREQVVIREIERLGGGVDTVWDGPDWLKFGVKWLPKKVIDDLTWFERVKFVDFYESHVDNEGLKHLSDLKTLYGLSIHNTLISDEGLKQIGILRNLRALGLYNTTVSDERLVHLSGLTNLEFLELINTQVTEEGVKELQKALPHCEISYR